MPSKSNHKISEEFNTLQGEKPYCNWHVLKDFVEESYSTWLKLSKEGLTPCTYYESEFTGNAFGNNSRRVWLTKEVITYLQDPENYKQPAEKMKGDAPDYSYIDLDAKPERHRKKGA